jgi:hypothetical protein
MLRHSTGFKLANDGHDTRSLAHYLAIATCNQPRATRRWPKGDLRNSGKTNSRMKWARRKLAGPSGPFTTTGKVGPSRLWLDNFYHFHFNLPENLGRLTS